MRTTAWIAAATVSLALGGCATANPRDPFENFNRVMFNFNDAIDKTALKPAAEAYTTLPSFMQIGVSNFFGNLGDPWIAVNNLMQGKVADGFSDIMRFTFNSTFGLGGMLDIASEAGLPKHQEDLGQTLGKWGVQSGPYVVLPVFGSSTLRDAAVVPVEFWADPWHYKEPGHVRYPGSALRAIDQRSTVLDASNLLEEAALDRYVFVRDAYMQRRQNKVYDGDPPSSAYEFDVGPTIAEDEAAPKTQAADGVATKAAVEPVEKPVVK